MLSRLILLYFVLFLFNSNSFGQLYLTTSEEEYLINLFESNKWQDQLSDLDQSLIAAIVPHVLDYAGIAGNLIDNCIVHGLNCSNEDVEDFYNSRTKYHFERIYRLAEKTHFYSSTALDSILFNLIREDILLTQALDHGILEDRKILDLLIMRIAKRLRKGVESNLKIPKNWLTRHEINLLKYSRIEAKEALDRIILNREGCISHAGTPCYINQNLVLSYSHFLDAYLLNDLLDVDKGLALTIVEYKAIYRILSKRIAIGTVKFHKEVEEKLNQISAITSSEELRELNVSILDQIPDQVISKKELLRKILAADIKGKD